MHMGFGIVAFWPLIINSRFGLCPLDLMVRLGAVNKILFVIALIFAFLLVLFISVVTIRLHKSELKITDLTVALFLGQG